jgi:Phage protein (N4 Gp49/phage Sf6 gene 66) family
MPLTPPPGAPGSPVTAFGMPRDPAPGIDAALPPAVPAERAPVDVMADRERDIREREIAVEQREKALDDRLKEENIAPHAPTQAEIDQMVVAQYFFCPWDMVKDRTDVQPVVMAAMQCTTIAVLVLRNGFVLVGDSVCDNPEAYDQATGQKYATEDAKRPLWQLEAYQRRSIINGLVPFAPRR